MSSLLLESAKSVSLFLSSFFFSFMITFTRRNPLYRQIFSCPHSSFPLWLRWQAGVRYIGKSFLVLTLLFLENYVDKKELSNSVCWVSCPCIMGLVLLLLPLLLPFLSLFYGSSKLVHAGSCSLLCWPYRYCMPINSLHNLYTCYIKSVKTSWT